MRTHLIEQLVGRPLAISPAGAQALMMRAQAEMLGPKPGFLERFGLASAKEPTMAERFAGSPSYARGALAEPVYAVEDGVAILRIQWTLCPGDYASRDWIDYGGIAMQVRRALSDPEIHAVLLDIDSPGGLVDGLFDLVDDLTEMRGEKPIWALANENAFSAAYAIASAADRIILPKTAEVGSIGVVAVHWDESEWLTERGFKVTPVYSGSHKIDGAWFQALGDDVRTAWQNDLDGLRDLFVQTVAANRGIEAAAVHDTEAMIYRGQDGVDAGLADEVMRPKEAFKALVEEVSGKGSNTGVSAKQETDMSVKDKVQKRAAQRGGKPKAEQDTEDEAVNENEEETAENQDNDPDEDAASDAGDPSEEEAAADGDGEEEAADQDGDEDEGEDTVTAERNRISAILGLKEAEGREGLARELAFTEGMTSETAKKLLGKAGKETGSLSQRMEGVDTPDTGADTGKPRSILSEKVKRRVERLKR